MGFTNLSLPAFGGVLTGQIGTVYPIAVPGSGTMQFVTSNLGVASQPTNVLTVRVGKNVAAGTPDVDFTVLVFVGVALTFTKDLSATPIAFGPTDTLQLMIVSETQPGGSEDFSGNVTFNIPSSSFAPGASYTTVAAVKEIVAIEAANTDFDAMIDQIIQGVSSAFDHYIGVSLTAHVLTEYHDGGGIVGPILLNEPPSEEQVIRDLATCEESGVLLTLGTDWFLDPFPSRTAYRLDGSGNQGAFAFAKGTRNVKFIYETLFSVTPNDIVTAATEESARKYWNVNTKDGAGDNRIGVVSRANEIGTSLSFVPDDWSPGTVRTLDTYRHSRYA